MDYELFSDKSREYYVQGCRTLHTNPIIIPSWQNIFPHKSLCNTEAMESKVHVQHPYSNCVTSSAGWVGLVITKQHAYL